MRVELAPLHEPIILEVLELYRTFLPWVIVCRLSDFRLYLANIEHHIFSLIPA